MSYDLRVWKHPPRQPLPTTAREASHLVTILSVQFETCPEFRALASQLKARFREVAAADERQRPWAGNALAADSGRAVYDVELNSGTVDKVKPVVIDTALALGLLVLDPQTGEMFVPPQAGPDAAQPLERGDVRDLFVLGLDGVLSSHGFVYHRKGGRFERNFSGGFHRLIVPKLEFRTDYPFSLNVAVRLDCINDAITRICGADLTTGADLYTLQLPLEYFLDRPNYTFAVHTTKDMAAALRVVAITVEKKVLPFLDGLMSVEQFEHFINAAGTSAAHFPLQNETGLVAARMVNPGAFDALAARYALELKARHAPASAVDRLQKITTALRAELAGQR